MQIEISSVNRKQFEARFIMPQELAALENSGRKYVASLVSRGAVQVRVNVGSASGSSGVTVDRNTLDMLISEAAAARKRNGMSGEVDVEALFALPGVIAGSAIDGSSEETAEVFERALKAAGENYQAMRRTEGENLKLDLEKRLKSLEMMHGELYMMTSMQPDLVKQRLLNRFANEKFPIEADDPTLLREVLFYIDRGDVTEELTRLSSHFEQFRKFLDSDVPVGRSLDFLMQELFREITTLGNKAFAGGVSRKVVAFKAEAEKIREQIQNVE
jgi:uncharacterized protein (TIGR00255 family)